MCSLEPVGLDLEAGEVMLPIEELGAQVELRWETVSLLALHRRGSLREVGAESEVAVAEDRPKPRVVLNGLLRLQHGELKLVVKGTDESGGVLRVLALLVVGRVKALGGESRENTALSRQDHR